MHQARSRVVAACLLAAIASITIMTLRTATVTEAQGTRVLLSDAVRQGTVEVKLHGSGDPFWMEGIAYDIRNLKSAPVTIVIPAGFILEPEDDSIQRIVVAKEYILVLCGTGPGTPAPAGTPCASTRVTGKWYGFCINLSRHAPDQDSVFGSGEMATGPLLQVIQSVNRKNAAGRLGAQFAVWRVTDDFTLEAINSPDMQNSELIQVIAPLLSLARPEIDLAQSILEDSNTGLKFYSGTPPPNLFEPGGLFSPGTSTGIPEIDSLKKQAEDAARNVMIFGGLGVGACMLSCLGVVGVIAFFALRKR